jgi:hypothetical protein
MAPILSNILYSSLLLFLSWASGAWLHSMGKPLNFLVNTLHKLISLASILLAGIALFQIAKSSAFGAPAVIALIASILTTAGLLATGSFLSSNKPLPDALLFIHRVLMALAIISFALAAYWLAGY